MDGMKRTKGFLATILSAMAYGSAPMIAMLVYRYGFGVNSVSLMRVLLPVPVLALVVTPAVPQIYPHCSFSACRNSAINSSALINIYHLSLSY